MLKRRLILSALTALIALASVAQQRSEITLSAGPSFPVGSFNKLSADPFVSSSSANKGYIADLAYFHPIHHSGFGLTAQLWGRLNGNNENALIAGYSSDYPGLNWRSPKGNWKTAALMAGIYYSLPISRKLQAKAALIAGAAEAGNPGWTVVGVENSASPPNPTDSIRVNVNKGSATSFSVLGSLGFTYKICPHLHLVVNVDYWRSKPTFKNLTGSAYKLNNNPIIPVQSDTFSSDITQSMNSLDFTAGLALSL